MTRPSRVCLPACLMILLASAAAAQIVEPDPQTARLRLGPVALNPVIDLTNFGIDTNVFNETGGAAKRDVTFTLSPRTDVWMRMGRTWLTGNVREDILWYQKYDSERAANTSATVGLIAPLNRLAIGLNTGYVRARDRPGFEIDARTQHTDIQVGGSVEVRALARTLLGVQGSRKTIDFEEGARFGGSDLRVELNRTSTAAALTIRQELTPLTSVTVDAGRIEDRFEFSPLRDSNSTSVGVQLTFDPAALIKGSARFGYRDFEPDSPDVSPYKGTTVAVNLAYSLLGTTRFDVQLTRDVQYSFDVNQPYYLQTGFSGSIAQQIFGPVDVVAGLSRYNLAYRDREGVTLAFADRTDRVRSYHGGVGYHLGPEVRIGVKAEKQQRFSDVLLRTYEGLRIGMSVTYGF